MADDAGTGAAEETEVTTSADAPITNLDTVIETELAKPEEGSDDSGHQDGQDDDKDESTVEESGDKEGSEGSGDESEDGADADDDGRSVESDDKPVPTKSEEDKPAPQLDTDITKAGEGKIAVKTFDGKTIYLNSLDELPDDFEPASYKEFAKATMELNAKAQAEAQDQAKREAEDAEKAQADRIKAIRDGWATEVDTLTKAGTLPKDDKERTKVVQGVYDLMRQEAKNGKQFQSWEIAHEVYQYRQQKIEQAEKQKQAGEIKKKQAGHIMSSGSNAAIGTKNVGLRPGMSIDDIIDNEIAG